MDQNDKQRLDIHILHNPFPKAFTFLWDNFKYTIPASGDLPAVYGVAVHGANRLVEKLIEINHSYPQVRDRLLRKKYLAQVLPTIDANEIIGDPLKVEEVKSEEGFSNELPAAPSVVPVGTTEGFDSGVVSEIDAEVDLNPIAVNEDPIPTEEELRQEALTDSLPMIAREQELNALDYFTELKPLTKRLGINSTQSKQALIEQIIAKENK